MKKVVTFGEIMLRLAPPGFLRFSQTNSFDVIYGGGESNVAVSLANYGVPVRFVSRVPSNDIGECALMEMRKRGVETDFMLRGGDRLGIYFLETGAVSRGSKVVYDRAHSAMSEIEPGMVDWDKAFKGVEWFHWTGITPAISQSAADACLEAVKIASEKGITISTDLNYRAKLWKYCNDAHREKIMTELTSYCDIVLGNEEDAEMHFGIKPEGLTVQTQGHDVKAEAFLSVCKQMMEKFPKAKKVITTLRGSISASHNTWAGVLYDWKNHVRHHPVSNHGHCRPCRWWRLVYGWSYLWITKISRQRPTCTRLCSGSLLLKAYHKRRCEPCNSCRSRKTNGW
jgi:2-dehydro-3-deoxygluconokinase